MQTPHRRVISIPREPRASDQKPRSDVTHDRQVIWGEVVSCDRQLSPFTPLGVVHAALAVHYLILILYTLLYGMGTIAFDWKNMSIFWGGVAGILIGTQWYFHNAYLNSARTQSHDDNLHADSHPEYIPGAPMVYQLYDTVFSTTLSTFLIFVAVAWFVVAAGGLAEVGKMDRPAQVVLIIVLLTVSMHALAACIDGLVVQAFPINSIQRIRVWKKNNI